VIHDGVHTTQIDVAGIKARMDAGDQRMGRIEASVYDLREDMRHVRRNGKGWADLPAVAWFDLQPVLADNSVVAAKEKSKKSFTQHGAPRHL
jgi:hypothetical protein